MRPITLLAGSLCGALAIGIAAAEADTMHPELGARLVGMGEHGVVNLQSNASKGRLCWTFDVATKGLTGASVRDSAGMVVAKLGSSYAAKSCASVPAKTLRLIESKPGSYMVWLDTKGHPGDLRGKLFAGMAHM
ncbi:MAG TPA: hypothetical protein VFA88_00405 [Gaiellaceae bacterium]|jgi:hypothetical protein|nr:hypothetical protein [Gaiellaceae bacterium]